MLGAGDQPVAIVQHRRIGEVAQLTGKILAPDHLADTVHADHGGYVVLGADDHVPPVWSSAHGIAHQGGQSGIADLVIALHRGNHADDLAERVGGAAIGDILADGKVAVGSIGMCRLGAGARAAIPKVPTVAGGGLAGIEDGQGSSAELCSKASDREGAVPGLAQGVLSAAVAGDQTDCIGAIATEGVAGLGQHAACAISKIPMVVVRIAARIGKLQAVCLAGRDPKACCRLAGIDIQCVVGGVPARRVQQYQPDGIGARGGWGPIQRIPYADLRAIDQPDQAVGSTVCKAAQQCRLSSTGSGRQEELCGQAGIDLDGDRIAAAIVDPGQCDGVGSHPRKLVHRVFARAGAAVSKVIGQCMVASDQVIERDQTTTQHAVHSTLHTGAMASAYRGGQRIQTAGHRVGIGCQGQSPGTPGQERSAACHDGGKRDIGEGRECGAAAATARESWCDDDAGSSFRWGEAGLGTFNHQDAFPKWGGRLGQGGPVGEAIPVRDVFVADNGAQRVQNELAMAVVLRVISANERNRDGAVVVLVGDGEVFPAGEHARTEREKSTTVANRNVPLPKGL